MCVTINRPARAALAVSPASSGVGCTCSPSAGTCVLSASHSSTRRAAERFQVSPTTAQRWAGRYRELGEAEMSDRPSRPHHSPRRTPTRTGRRIIKVRLVRRWGPARIAHLLGLMPATASPASVPPRWDRSARSRSSLFDPSCAGVCPALPTALRAGAVFPLTPSGVSEPNRCSLNPAYQLAAYQALPNTVPVAAAAALASTTREETQSGRRRPDDRELGRIGPSVRMRAQSRAAGRSYSSRSVMSRKGSPSCRGRQPSGTGGRCSRAIAASALLISSWALLLRSPDVGEVLGSGWRHGPWGPDECGTAYNAVACGADWCTLRF